MWSSDFEVATGAWFGDWLHDAIAENAHFEQHGFMPDRVRVAAERLQRTRPAGERFVAEVPWFNAFTAFTAPGRYIYFSRALLERCPHEDSAAFVIAHEIAHHDLGHLAHFRGPFARRAARFQRIHPGVPGGALSMTLSTPGSPQERRQRVQEPGP